MNARTILFFLIPTLAFGTCQAQTKSVVGGGCDGCELMYEGMPKQLTPSTTSAGWSGPGQKLIVTGRVYKRDGKTPASNVIIYYWHTDHTGHYTAKSGKGKAARHGDLRGWMKTDVEGKYTLRTSRPAPYPDKSMPAHIHLAVKEPDISPEYYVDELVFDDDPLLTTSQRKKLENRGGSGILRPTSSGNIQTAGHNITLGLNIPNYPVSLMPEKQSGLEVGLDQPSFTPFHAYGPDKGSVACPVCKYGRHYGILYFVGNHPDWTEIEKWLTFLERESLRRGEYLKVYFVLSSDKIGGVNGTRIRLETLGKKLNISKTALTFVPSFADLKSDIAASNINPEVANTFIVYKNRQIIAKYIDLQPNLQNFRILESQVRN